MTEEWRTCVYNGVVFERYEVSNTGKVRSLNFNRTGKTKELKQTKINSGYLQVQLWKKGSEKSKYCLVHRLVAEVFIPNPNNLPEVNHIDENKENNSVENLEWLSHPKNIIHGTGVERCAKAKYKCVKATNIKTGEVIIFDSIKKASEETGASKTVIINICKKKEHSKTSHGYTFEYYNGNKVK